MNKLFVVTNRILSYPLFSTYGEDSVSATKLHTDSKRPMKTECQLI